MIGKQQHQMRNQKTNAPFVEFLARDIIVPESAGSQRITINLKQFKMKKEVKPALKIREALDFHEKTKGKDEPSILKGDLADVLFEGAGDKTRPVNFSNLIGGRTERVSPKWVLHICEVTGVDANFLFGVKPMNLKKLEQYESGKNNE